MKALRMTFTSEVTKAMKNPIKDMTQLRGGIGDKKLDHHQIRRLIAERKLEQRQRQEKAEQRALAMKLNRQLAKDAKASI